MTLDYCPLTVTQFNKGDFPVHHTSVLKVGQVTGYQLYTSIDDCLAELATLFLSLKSVNYVEISSIDYFGDSYMSMMITRKTISKLLKKLKSE